jgi:hypothetical protein
MATASATGQSKTAFVRDFIRKNPNANRKDVEEAWLGAGNEGPIHSSLVSNLRAEAGLTGKKRRGGRSRRAERDGAAESTLAATPVAKPKRRGRKKGRKAKANAATATATERQPRSGGQGKAMAEIEQDIDRLIFKLMVVGGFEGIEGELRKVRRLLYHSDQA